VSLALLAGLWACEGPCPDGMVRIQGVGGPFCIHAYEAQVEGGVRVMGPVRSATGLEPTMGASWKQARRACERSGMHLCTSQEWEDACDGQPGEGGRAHPTLDGSYVRKACGIAAYGVHFEPWLAPAGSYPDCRTPEGVYDMMGNLWEWTDPEQVGAEGQPLTDKRGGAHYSQGPVACSFHALGMHPPVFTGSIGFRCCTGVR